MDQGPLNGTTSALLNCTGFYFRKLACSAEGSVAFVLSDIRSQEAPLQGATPFYEKGSGQKCLNWLQN